MPQTFATRARAGLDGPLLGQGDAVARLRRRIDEAAATNGPVLLAGEPGVGFEAVARAIHAAGADRSAPFRAVQATLLGSASTSGPSTSDPSWWGRLAPGGTVFVEGLDRLDAAGRQGLRAYLALEDRPTRVVASVYVGAGASGPSRDRVAEWLGRRWSRSLIPVPPLRERSEDIPELVRHYAQLHAGRLGGAPPLPDAATLEVLRRHPWPGNVAELSRLVERALLSGGGGELVIAPGSLDARRVVGRYRLMAKIGAGGMGEVWSAEHQQLPRAAAIKLVRRDEEDENLLARFRREARVTASLRSAHTVELYDFGMAPGGEFYYVMELLDGLDLRTLVEQHGPVDPARVVHILAQACVSLAEAHEAGLVHRDVKPANIMLCRLGLETDFVKVLDLGMVTAPSPEDTQLTAQGSFRGTPAFLSPESLGGTVAVDARADLYSLGAVAFYLLTGEHVFPGKSAMKVLMDHASTPPRRPSEVRGSPIPAALEAIVLACLAKQPDDRPASALALRDRLLQLTPTPAWTAARADAWWSEHAPPPGERWGLSRPVVSEVGADVETTNVAGTLTRGPR